MLFVMVVTFILFSAQQSIISPGKLFFRPLNNTLFPHLEHRTLCTSGFSRHLAAPCLRMVCVPLISARLIVTFFSWGGTYPAGGDSARRTTGTVVVVAVEVEVEVEVAEVVVTLPQGAIMNTWSTRWNMGWFVSPPHKSPTLYLSSLPCTPSFRYAARGYAVIAVNFHGSTGFGQHFCDIIRGDWGGQPCVLGTIPL